VVLDRLIKGIALDHDYYETVAEEPAGEVLDLLRYKVAEQIIALEAALKK